MPVKHRIGKPVLPTITASTQLKDLVGPESWKILKVAGYSKENVEQWLKGESKEGFEKFKFFTHKASTILQRDIFGSSRISSIVIKMNI